MARKRKVGNPLALAVLSHLTTGPMHPYELGRILRAHDVARSVRFNHGSLYMVVRQLAEAELITPQETTREGQRPERTVYAITAAGRAEIHDWLSELVAEPQHEYPSFVAALSLIGALRPDEVVTLLRRRLARLDERRKESRELQEDHAARGQHPLFMVEEDYRLALADAEYAFVERFIERIEHPRTGWAEEWAAFHRERA